MAMKMSKLALSKLLQKTGMWEESQEVLNRIRRENRTQKGWSREKSTADAWQKVEEQFAKAAEEKAAEMAAKAEEARAAKKEAEKVEKQKRAVKLPANFNIDEFDGELSPSQFIADAMWVYGRVAAPMDEVGSPPSAGAMGMLAWAKESPQKFFEQMMPKVLALHEKRAKQDEVDEDTVKELERVDELRAMLGLMKEEIEGAGKTEG